MFGPLSCFKNPMFLQWSGNLYWSTENSGLLCQVQYQLAIYYVASFHITPLYLLYGQLVHIDNSKLALVHIVCFSV